ncbi:MAG: DUF2157 domain-containing protein [Clostridia bacterium]|nr:DUF2157 domain-containing protein [Clostridia bacterium]
MKESEIKKMLDDHVIDESTYNRILEYNRNKNKKDPESSSKKTNMLLNILAAIFIVLGIGWIIAANWNVIPKGIKLTFTLLCSLANIYYLMKAKNCEKNRRVKLEIGSLTYVGFLMASIALIGQIFNLDSNLTMFFLTVITIIGLVTLYTDAKINEQFYLLVSGIYLLCVGNLFSRMDAGILAQYDEIGLLVTFIILAIIPGIIIYRNQKQNLELEDNDTKTFIKLNNKKVLVLGFYISLIFFAVYSMMLVKSFVLTLFTLFIFMQLAKKLKLNATRKILLLLSYIAMYIETLTFVDFLIVFDNSIIKFIIVGLMLIVSLLILFRQIKNRKNANENLIDTHEEIFINCFNILTMTSGVVFTLLDVEFEFISYVMLLLFIIWLLRLMYESLKENRLNHFYLAELCFTVEVLRFILVEMDSLMLRGIVCIITAIVILIINRMINKKEKAKKEIENKNN